MLTMTEGMGPYKPSMMIDRLAGRPLELHSIYALPLARAAEHGATMPSVSLLHALLDLGEGQPS
jgi:2-dehydropantoate 2-reductase